MNKWYRIGLTSALLPLVTGTTIFVAWLFTRQDWLMGAGMYTIAFGLILFVFGLVAVFFIARNAKKQGQACGKQIVLLICLLAVNFPVAMGMTFYALDIKAEYKVVIVNHSSESAHIVFSDPMGKNHTLPNVAPHSKTQTVFNFEGEGSVNYHVTSKTIDRSGTLFGYITHGTGGSVEVELVIHEDGRIKVNPG
jgi:hypothetical protein